AGSFNVHTRNQHQQQQQQPQQNQQQPLSTRSRRQDLDERQEHHEFDERHQRGHDGDDDNRTRDSIMCGKHNSTTNIDVHKMNYHDETQQPEVLPTSVGSISASEINDGHASSGDVRSVRQSRHAHNTENMDVTETNKSVIIIIEASSFDFATPIVAAAHLATNVPSPQYTSVATFDAVRLASYANAVVVTSNYRLNAYGFVPELGLKQQLDNSTTSPDEQSMDIEEQQVQGSDYNKKRRHIAARVDGDNFALMDQVAALDWVKRNIHAFGGDANRVTVLATQKAAVHVALLLASPLAK
ncbi:Carboxylesterase 5A, partial [Fragariocoptes setiger]